MLPLSTVAAVPDVTFLFLLGEDTFLTYGHWLVPPPRPSWRCCAKVNGHNLMVSVGSLFIWHCCLSFQCNGDGSHYLLWFYHLSLRMEFVACTCICVFWCLYMCIGAYTLLGSMWNGGPLCIWLGWSCLIQWSKPCMKPQLHKFIKTSFRHTLGYMW